MRILPSMFTLYLLLLSAASATINPNKVMGPDECAECHDVENGIWEGTHHFTTFENMPEADEALSIAKKLDIDDVIESDICQSCHLTQQTEDDESEIIAGVSCESCHGAALDWIDVHSEEEKAADQAPLIWKKAEAGGMIRPGNLVSLVGNCLDCHLVMQETLVNTGGHPAGSEFNLVTWSQGEVRHNTFHSENGENRPATQTKLRKMLVVGASIELQRAIIAYATAENPDGKYALSMRKRIEKTKLQLKAITETKASPLFEELQLRASQTPADNLPDNQQLAMQIKHIVGKLQTEDASQWQALDAIINQLGPNQGDVQE